MRTNLGFRAHSINNVPKASVPGRASNRSASNNDLVTRRTRLKLGERAFFFAAARIWNPVPIEIKAATDT